jgi:hypothetical protein
MKTNLKKLRAAAAILGAHGGKSGVGKCKARTSEQARAAAVARWAKRDAIAEILAAIHERLAAIHERRSGGEARCSDHGEGENDLTEK